MGSTACSAGWGTPTLRQTWVVSATLLNKFGQGMVVGVSSAMIAGLRAPSAPIRLDTHSTSWIVSSLAFATLSGFPIVSVLMITFGRKFSYCLMNLPVVMGMTLIASGSDVPAFIVGRVLCGITTGTTAILGVVTVGEFVSPHLRGVFLTLNAAFYNLGSLFIHVLAHFVDWRIASYACIVPFAAAIAVALTWPESPSWLAERRRFNDSTRVFYWLRGKTVASSREIEQIIQSYQIEQKKKTMVEILLALASKFRKRNFVKPLIIITFTSIMLEAGGRHVFPSYATVIVREVSNDIDPFLCNIVIDLFITISAFSSTYFISMFKLRKMLFSTGVSSVILLNLSSLTLYLVTGGILSQLFSWVPVTLLSLYFLVVNLCCTTVPLTIIGEIFPLQHRAAGTFISGLILGLIFSTTLKITPYLIDVFETHGALAMFAGALAVSLSVLYFILPETKNKTLLEIEYFFVYGSYPGNDVGEPLQDVRQLTPYTYNKINS